MIVNDKNISYEGRIKDLPRGANPKNEGITR